MKNYIFVAFLDPVLHDLAVEASWILPFGWYVKDHYVGTQKKKNWIQHDSHMCVNQNMLMLN